MLILKKQKIKFIFLAFFNFFGIFQFILLYINTILLLLILYFLIKLKILNRKNKIFIHKKYIFTIYKNILIL